MPTNAIINFKNISDRLSIGGQPTIDQLMLLKDANFTMILQLALKEVPTSTQNEAYHARMRKLNYQMMEISYNHPTVSDVENFFQIMDAYPNERLYVHCSVGYCTSGLMVMYLMQREHLSYDASKHLVIPNWQPIPVWQDLIQTVTGMPIRESA